MDLIEEEAKRAVTCLVSLRELNIYPLLARVAEEEGLLTWWFEILQSARPSQKRGLLPLRFDFTNTFIDDGVSLHDLFANAPLDVLAILYFSLPDSFYLSMDPTGRLPQIMQLPLNGKQLPFPFQKATRVVQSEDKDPSAPVDDHVAAHAAEGGVDGSSFNAQTLYFAKCSSCDKACSTRTTSFAPLNEKEQLSSTTSTVQGGGASKRNVFVPPQMKSPSAPVVHEVRVLRTVLEELLMTHRLGSSVAAGGVPPFGHNSSNYSSLNASHVGVASSPNIVSAIAPSDVHQHTYVHPHHDESDPSIRQPQPQVDRVLSSSSTMHTTMMPYRCSSSASSACPTVLSSVDSHFVPSSPAINTLHNPSESNFLIDFNLNQACSASKKTTTNSTANSQSHTLSTNASTPQDSVNAPPPVFTSRSPRFHQPSDVPSCHQQPAVSSASSFHRLPSSSCSEKGSSFKEKNCFSTSDLLFTPPPKQPSPSNPNALNHQCVPLVTKQSLCNSNLPHPHLPQKNDVISNLSSFCAHNFAPPSSCSPPPSYTQESSACCGAADGAQCFPPQTVGALPLSSSFLCSSASSLPSYTLPLCRTQSDTRNNKIHGNSHHLTANSSHSFLTLKHSSSHGHKAAHSKHRHCDANSSHHSHHRSQRSLHSYGLYPGDQDDFLNEEDDDEVNCCPYHRNNQHLMSHRSSSIIQQQLQSAQAQQQDNGDCAFVSHAPSNASSHAMSSCRVSVSCGNPNCCVVPTSSSSSSSSSNLSTNSTVKAGVSKFKNSA
eukprot:GDKJ01029004.1.p1 GENE.GDKJ01029004.1~~GDKJ01029004.1.p1  ORF type:complete len:786 (-),score=216.06 GDKJ01029004.1:162-2471(-)